MRFYRLEKTNYIKIWTGAILKSLLISLMAVVVLMLCMGYKFMIVVSSSMEPTMPVGCLVLITPCDYDDLKEGDIVTMDKNGINLTHRVVGKGETDRNGDVHYYEKGEEGYEEAFWCTKGDNSDTHDGEITGDVVGVVKENHIFELTGDIVRYIKNNTMVVIIFAVIFVVFFEAVNYLKGKLVVDDIESYEWEEE
jgi:signal peptidase